MGHQLLVPGDDDAHPGAGGGEPLGHGVHHDHILCGVLKFQHGGHGLAAVDQLPVDLVADEEEAVLLGDVRHEPPLLGRQHQAGGVAGVGHQDGPGPGGDPGLDLLPGGKAVARLRVGGNGTDRRAGHPDEGVIVGIVGLGHQNLVPILQQAGKEDLQGLAAAVGRQDIVTGDGIAQSGVIIPGRLQIRLHAGRGGIGQNLFTKALHCVKERLRSLNVRLADVQPIDRPPLGLRLHHIGMELPNRGEMARFDSAGKFHSHCLLNLRTGRSA